MAPCSKFIIEHGISEISQQIEAISKALRPARETHIHKQNKSANKCAAPTQILMRNLWSFWCSCQVASKPRWSSSSKRASKRASRIWVVENVPTRRFHLEFPNKSSLEWTTENRWSHCADHLPRVPHHFCRRPFTRQPRALGYGHTTYIWHPPFVKSYSTAKCTGPMRSSFLN